MEKNSYELNNIVKEVNPSSHCQERLQLSSSLEDSRDLKKSSAN